MEGPWFVCVDTPLTSCALLLIMCVCACVQRPNKNRKPMEEYYQDDARELGEDTTQY